MATTTRCWEWAQPMKMAWLKSAYARREFAGFQPAMIIAKTENDFNYLPFNNTKVNTSSFETGGKRINSSMLDAFIYPERDIYRPGERINFSAIVRDRNWKVPGTLPVNFKFLLPNGKELRSFRKSLNEQGSVEGQMDLSSSAITGTYSWKCILPTMFCWVHKISVLKNLCRTE